MKIKSYLSLIFSLLLIVAFVSANAQIKYEDDFKDPETAAKKLVKVNLNWLNKAGVKTVIIHNFVGEFVTSKETSPSAFEQSHSTRWTSKTVGFTMGSDYYATIVNALYAEFVEMLKENGIEVLDKSILTNNQAYNDLGLEDERERKGYSGGVMKQQTTTTTLRRGPEGMGVLPDIAVGKFVKLGKITAQIAVDKNCQASLGVAIRVDIGKNGIPVLNQMSVSMNSDVKQTGGKPYWNNGGIEIMAMKDALYDPKADIMKDGSKKDLDLGKYNEELFKLIDTVNKAYVYEFKNQYKK